ncbi:hypothetical protein SAY86_013461 [Trapa natans]|uniref:Uncharacterized protein n=1 Tax=Trapa natans TaxID=22666 RepID=A0AAN7RA51_TRANT|nr:hypothetical protein SAY86_013461 [Trapa natans]
MILDSTLFCGLDFVGICIIVGSGRRIFNLVLGRIAVILPPVDRWTYDLLSGERQWTLVVCFYVCTIGLDRVNSGQLTLIEMGLYSLVKRLIVYVEVGVVPWQSSWVHKLKMVERPNPFFMGFGRMVVQAHLDPSKLFTSLK